MPNYYNQIIEKDNYGNEEIALICQHCWYKGSITKGIECYERKCSKKLTECSYRIEDIDIKKKLKNCPMCGSDDIKVGLNNGHEFGMWYVKCRNCGLSNEFLFEDHKKIDVYKYWNTRKKKIITELKEV